MALKADVRAMIKAGYCPYCKRLRQRLVKHHLDYRTNLTVYICHDCHLKEHFPSGKKGERVVLSERAKRHIYYMLNDNTGAYRERSVIRTGRVRKVS